MKRNSLLLAIALPAAIGAALWGVNFRLNHPPLSRADTQFSALVAGADSVVASQWACQGNCAENWRIKYQPLNMAQTRELIEQMRFTDDRHLPFNAIAPGTVNLDLTFRRRGTELIRYSLWETPHSISLVHVIPSIIDASYQLHPRFEKPLRRTLDEVLPQRIRP